MGRNGGGTSNNDSESFPVCGNSYTVCSGTRDARPLDVVVRRHFQNADSSWPPRSFPGGGDQLDRSTAVLGR